MDDFTTLPKMQCFKEGGSVKNFTKRDRKSMDSADIAQDKKIVKKAISMHDKQEHKGEHTDLSKLKKGGRAKKDCGTVRKYKSGGSVTNVYEAKKSSGDKDNIRKTKEITPAKAEAPSKAAVKAKDFGAKTIGPSGHKDPYIKSKESGKSAAAPSGAGGPDAYKKGGKVKKFSGADGSYVGISKPANAPSAPVGQGQITELEKQHNLEKMKRAQKYLNQDQQAQLIKQDPRAAGLMGNIGYKKGGKVCR